MCCYRAQESLLIRSFLWWMWWTCWTFLCNNKRLFDRITDYFMFYINVNILRYNCWFCFSFDNYLTQNIFVQFENWSFVTLSWNAFQDDNKSSFLDVLACDILYTEHTQSMAPVMCDKHFDHSKRSHTELSRALICLH